MIAEQGGAPALDFAGWQNAEAPGDETRGQANPPRTTEEDSALAENCRPLDVYTGSTTREQRLHNLSVANVVRLDKAETRKRLHSLELPFDEFLDETPACCLKLSVAKLLTWLPNIGRPRAYSIIDQLRMENPEVTADTRVGELTNRDKYMLSGLVSGLLESHRRYYLATA